eukprot:gene27571-50093_t
MTGGGPCCGALAGTGFACEGESSQERFLKLLLIEPLVTVSIATFIMWAHYIPKRGFTTAFQVGMLLTARMPQRAFAASMCVIAAGIVCIDWYNSWLALTSADKGLGFGLFTVPGWTPNAEERISKLTMCAQPPCPSGPRAQQVVEGAAGAALPPRRRGEQLRARPKKP